MEAAGGWRHDGAAQLRCWLVDGIVSVMHLGKDRLPVGTGTGGFPLYKLPGILTVMVFTSVYSLKPYSPLKQRTTSISTSSFINNSFTSYNSAAN